MVLDIANAGHMSCCETHMLCPLLQLILLQLFLLLIFCSAEATYSKRRHTCCRSTPLLPPSPFPPFHLHDAPPMLLCSNSGSLHLHGNKVVVPLGSC